MDETSPLRIAKILELDKLEEALEALAREFEEKFKAEHRLLISKGLGSSGVALKTYMRLQREHGEKLVEQMLHLRENNMARVPLLLDSNELLRWQKILEEKLDAIFSTRLDFPKIPTAAKAEVERITQENKAEVIRALQRRIRVMDADASLPPRPRPDTVHIEAGAGSIVTVGNISRSTLSVLNQAMPENAELARALADLTKAVEASTNLDTTHKQKSLESLEFIAKQVAAKPDQREKPVVIRAVWSSMSEILAVASNVATIYGAATPLFHKFMTGI